MKIILINPPINTALDNIVEPPLGILYIQSFTNKNGHECVVHDCNIHGEDIHDIPIGNLYGFSTYTHNYSWCLRKIKELRNRDKNCICVAGGCHVSALPNECKKDWDYIVVGEGEEGLLDVLGLGYDAIKTIDDLPFPIYTDEIITKYSRKTEDKQRVLSILGSRGCPNRCNFCNCSINKLYPPRSRTVNNILEEIDLLIERGIRNFKFNDDNFLEVIDQPHKLCEALKERNIKYRIMTSSQSLTKENSVMLKETGCQFISIGIESMSKKMLELMNKTSTVEDNIDAINNVTKTGIFLRLFLLVGFPGETEDTVNETINLLRNLKFDSFLVSVFLPFPGTDVFSNPRKYNAIIDKDFDKYVTFNKEEAGGLVLDTNYFTKQDVKRWRDKIRLELLKNHSWRSS
jgi:radical SAM superfamily enzyme YgiQ (UPF0313 family)